MGWVQVQHDGLKKSMPLPLPVQYRATLLFRAIECLSTTVSWAGGGDARTDEILSLFDEPDPLRALHRNAVGGAPLLRRGRDHHVRGRSFEDLRLEHVENVTHALERSEEHTSELQSRRDLVCRLRLEKKN